MLMAGRYLRETSNSKYNRRTRMGILMAEKVLKTHYLPILCSIWGPEVLITEIFAKKTKNTEKKWALNVKVHLK